ncbi:aminotransferase class IV [Spirosoma soli]|uniref:branched-chain-amino-acid transaminase n=1 Tax=Spirosoma soli TaxID=1770529 RepID=A0ABW5MBB1_9BACT
MNLVYNSDILPEEKFYVELNDRAFQYGDGLFETIRYENGTLWFWSDHYDRLTAGMKTLGLTYPDGFDVPLLYQSILQLLSSNELSDQTARVKIQVWRQTGGLYTPTTNCANVLITARPGSPFAITQKTNVDLYPAFRLAPSPVSSFKTLNSLPYVLAGVHKQSMGLDDVILLDTNGHLAECVASNLFWQSADTLFTPSCQTGCINGIARRQLLRMFPKAEEGFFLPEILKKADVVFAANVMGIQVFQGQFSPQYYQQLMQVFTAKSL